jgi:ATP-binding cassette, subfamily B, multidrug efflux pump
MLVGLLRAYLRPYRRPITAVVVLQLFSTIATLYLPTLNAEIIDNGVVKGDTSYILGAGGVMLAVSVVQMACSVSAVYFGSRTAMAFGRDLRREVFGRVQEFSQREFGRFGTPSLITRTTNDVQQVQMLALLSFTLMVSAPIVGVGSIILALNQNVPLSGLLVIVVPLLGIIVSLIVSKMRPLFRLMQARIDRVNQVLREQISGVRVIRAFVRDDFERSRFAVANEDLFTVGLGVGRLMGLMFPSVILVIQLASIATLWFGGHLINDGSMQVGSLTAFLSYLVQVLMAVMMATFMFVMVPRAEVCAERIDEVLGTEPSVLAALNPVPVDQARGLVQISGVEFRYPGAEEPVLRGVDLEARPGEVTAVIGSTGSGKTTLLNLIPRLFDATAGTVTIDGIDIRQVDEDALSGLIGLVPQRAYLFSGTVASNLRYGNPQASDEELWRALEIAQARGFVEAMSDGLGSPISQGGGNVSGGQRQRLAIARALVHRPRIYLFDDSFSALDYATDAALRSALADETAEATVLIVAQRVSTIRHANRIIVLEAGRVVGAGTHDELMAANPTYREIVLSQLSVEEAA